MDTQSLVTKTSLITELGLLRCPISMTFYYDPVIAEDGYTYERANIEAHFEIKHTSPMTNEPIGNSLTSNLILKQIIKNVLENNSNLRLKNYYDPVVAEDGYTYERAIIEAHFEINHTSPMTNEPIGNSLTSNLILKQIIKCIRK